MERRPRKYTKEFLEPFVKKANGFACLLRSLGLKQSGGIHRLIRQRIRQHNISIAHFKGHGWAKGLTKETDERVRKFAKNLSLPNHKVFCKNSSFNPSGLFRRLIVLGWEARCVVCSIKEWMGKPIRFHVDHINGDHSDHRLSNLRFLCPNCHQQTATWGAKNKDSTKKIPCC